MVFEENGTITFSMPLKEIERVFLVPAKDVENIVKNNDRDRLAPIIEFFDNTLVATIKYQMGVDIKGTGYTIRYAVQDNMFKVNFAIDVNSIIDSFLDDAFGDLEEVDDIYEEDDYEDYGFNTSAVKTIEAEPLAAIICNSMTDVQNACKVLRSVGIKKADLFKSIAGEYIVHIKDDIDDTIRNKLANIINSDYQMDYYSNDDTMKALVASAEEHNNYIIRDKAISIIA